MAADDDHDRSPSLEPPKLFGRRRRSSAEPTHEPEVAPDTRAATTGPDTPAPQDGDTRVFADTEAVFVDAGRDTAASPAPPAGEAPATTSTGPRRASRPRAARPSLPSWPTRRPRSRAAGATRSPRSPVAVPSFALAPAAGLLTGIALLVFVWAGLQGCEALRGGASCGAGPGMTYLVVVFAATVVVGRLLLGLLKVDEPGMTSFLAVGITCLVAVLVFSGLFESALMLVLLPLMSAAAFAASAWIATLQVDLDD